MVQAWIEERVEAMRRAQIPEDYPLVCATCGAPLEFCTPYLEVYAVPEGLRATNPVSYARIEGEQSERRVSLDPVHAPGEYAVSEHYLRCSKSPQHKTGWHYWGQAFHHVSGEGRLP